MGQIQNMEDLIGFILRRFWLIALLAITGIAVSAFLAKSRPDSYMASAAIQVQGAQVGDGSVNGSAQVLQSIEQRLTTREALLEMIDRHGLYTDMPGLTDDQKAALLRSSVTFEGVAAAGSQTYGAPAMISAIIITASDGDAENAARIANDFAQGVLDMSSSGQLERARDTFAFYREEEVRLSGQIAALEADIAAYKNANANALPAVAEAQREELVSLDGDLRDLEQKMVALAEEQRSLSARTDLRVTEQRRLKELDDELTVLNEQKDATAAKRSAVQAAIALSPEVERALAGYQRDLDQLQRNLDVVTLKLAEAETDQRLAERQQAERFALLDRAIVPQSPVGSGGKKLFVFGSIASVLGALVAAFMLDLLRPVVRTSTQMERQLGLRPVIAIPDLDLSAPIRHPGASKKTAA